MITIPTPATDSQKVPTPPHQSQTNEKKPRKTDSGKGKSPKKKKTKHHKGKGKLNNYFGSSLAGVSDLSEDYGEGYYGSSFEYDAATGTYRPASGSDSSTATASSASSSSSRSSNKPQKSVGENLVGKIQNLFTREETRQKMRENQVQQKEEDLKDYVYLQMILDLDKNGPEFEREIEQGRKMGIESRVASEADIDMVVKLYNRAFMTGADPWSPANTAQFEQIIHYGDTFMLIASSYGEDVGFIILDLEGANKEIGVICGLGTDPRWQGRGFARHLCLIAWLELKKRGVAKLKCEVYENNIPSYRLIKSLYFEEVGKKTYQF